jgi:hypothetical protein
MIGGALGSPKAAASDRPDAGCSWLNAYDNGIGPLYSVLAGQAPDVTDGYDPVPASADLAAPANRSQPGSARAASRAGAGRVGAEVGRIAVREFHRRPPDDGSVHPLEVPNCSVA